MQVIFDSKPLPAAKRRQAWRDAICEIYLQVDCAAERSADYEGFVREARFGGVTLTDTLISPQSVRRQRLHIAHFDKDFYYAGIEHIGRVNILQAGSSFVLRPGFGGITTPTSLTNFAATSIRVNIWIELPRQAFDSRFDSGRAAAARAFRSQPRPRPYRHRLLRRARGGGRRRSTPIPAPSSASNSWISSPWR